MRLVLIPVLSVFAAGLSSCRRYAPVERHFLRVSAEYAVGLSTIDRAKWLKRARKNPDVVRAAKEISHLQLPAITLPGNVNVPMGEVKFFLNKEGSPEGMVALHWQGKTGTPKSGGGRLWLLKTEGGRYVLQSATRWHPAGPGPWHYQLGSNPDTITAWRERGRLTKSNALPVVLHWQDGRWVRLP